MMNNTEILKKGAEDLGLSLNNKQIEQILKYKDLLIEWNAKMNLTAITEDRDIMIKHFLDALSCATLSCVTDDIKIIDVGTGAGFPGIPIKIYYSNISLTLLDSLKKRIHFLNEVCTQIGCTNVNLQHGRAEELGKKEGFRETYDIAVARAVAQLNVLCEYCLPFVKVGGYFVCQKGPNVDEEIKNAHRAMEILGGKLIEKKDIQLPFSDITHNILVIKKITKTPTKFPRKAGTPTKKPLI